MILKKQILKAREMEEKIILAQEQLEAMKKIIIKRMKENDFESDIAKITTRKTTNKNAVLKHFDKNSSFIKEEITSKVTYKIDQKELITTIEKDPTLKQEDFFKESSDLKFF